MHALVRTIFTRLHSLDPVIEEAKLQMNEEDTQEGEIKLTVAASVGPTDLAASQESGDGQGAAAGDSATLEKKLNSDEAESPIDSVSGPKPECRSLGSFY
jgi:golgi-specific brefeldin A-resistance guanine nucleotide exchange factor 1